MRQLLDRGLQVRAIVRSFGALADLAGDARLSLIQASVLDLGDAEMARCVSGCTAVLSCLGHNMTLNGMYGAPRRLVADATRRLCTAIRVNRPDAPVRFVLMNTAGNSNRDLAEPVSFSQKYVVGLARLLLPPHADNEQASDYLRTQVGQTDCMVEWAVVRPDSLRDAAVVTAYEVHPSPTRSAIFNAGATSRIHVAHFMAELATDTAAWSRWKGRMPVIYDQGMA
ncbi:NAD(P)H-binding protein [Achromobacter anxifer]